MQHNTSRMLFTYWDQLRAGRCTPQRNEVDPTYIATVLPHVLMLDCQQPDTYLFRIAGTKLCEYFGRELRGHNFLKLWHPFEQKSLRNKLTAAQKYGQPTMFAVESYTQCGEIVHSEVIMLPLSKPDGTIHRLLGAWSLTDRISWKNATPLTEHFLVEADKAISRHVSLGPVLPTCERPTGCDGHLGHEHQAVSPNRRFRVYQGGRP